MIRIEPKGLSKPSDVLSIVITNTAINEKLEFRSTGYEKKSFFPQDPFVVFNQCAEDFSEEKNNRIWELYNKIYHHLEFDKSDQRVAEAADICRQLLETVNYFDLKYSIETRRLALPSPDVNDVYTELLGERDRTYIKSDIADLIALSVLLKAMVPIWGQYIGEKVKNHDVIRLAFALCESGIKFLDPAIKLRSYVDSNFAANKTPLPSMAFTGVSTLNLPDVTFATIIIRKIATDPILNDGLYSKKLISGAWSVISSNTRQAHGGNTFRSKEPLRGGGDTDEPNMLERIRPTTAVPDGVVAAIRHIHKDVPALFAKEFPEVNRELLANAVINNQSTPWIITPGQTLVVTYLTDHFMPMEIPHLTLEHVKQLQAACYVVLKHYGHDHIADLLVAKITKNTKASFSLSAGRPNPPEQRVQEFNSLYRVHLAPTKVGEIKHPAQAFIDQFVTDVTQNQVTGYDPYTNETSGPIPIEMSIRTKLIDFVEFCLNLQ